MIFGISHNTLDSLWPNKNLAKTPVGIDGATEFIINSTFSSASAISPVMTHSVFESLRSQGLITMVRGLHSYPYYQGHGNQSVGNANDKVTPTFDYIIENSKSVYPITTSPYVTKAIRVSAAAGGSSFLKPSGTGGVQGQPSFFSGSPSTMFKTVFSSLTAGTVAPVDLTNQLKSNILNRVFNSYTSLKANRRISSEDKLRVDEHLGYLSDLQKKFVVTPGTQQLTCTAPTSPSDPTGYLDKVPIFLNLTALAFKCGLTKLGMFEPDGDGPPMPAVPAGVPVGTYFHGALHGSVAGVSKTQANQYYTLWLKWLLDTLGTQFLAPLNAEEGATGKTYLDNMLTTILFEGGGIPDTDGFGHINSDFQQIILGSMGGKLRANRYYHLPHFGDGAFGRYDLPYNSFLMTIMDLMGVPASEYNAFGTGGKGYGVYGTPADALISMPWIKPPTSWTNTLTNRFYSPISEIKS